MRNRSLNSLNRRHFAAVALALQMVTVPAMGQEAVRLVLKGYDPVAYFTLGTATQGDPRFSHDFDGGRYHFVSAEHRDLFITDPERYAPQFGGFCTGFMSRGVRSEGDPHGWVVHEGRLYVFGQAKFREVALSDPNFLASRLPGARTNWQKMKPGS